MALGPGKYEERQAALRRLRSEVTQHKSRLLDILRRVEEVNKREADALGRILARLEDWQNR